MGVSFSRIACIAAGERPLRIGYSKPAGPKTFWEKTDPNAIGPFIHLVVEFAVPVAQRLANLIDGDELYECRSRTLAVLETALAKGLLASGEIVRDLSPIKKQGRRLRTDSLSLR